MEKAIHISSINREKTGENRPDNFIIKFSPPLNLNRDMKHSLAIDRLTMTYLGIISKVNTKIIQSNIQTMEELIRIRLLLKMECIHILIFMNMLNSI